MDNHLRQLFGSRLTSVIFVLDYVIIGFEGGRALTLLLWPTIYKDAQRSVSGMAEYRDALCSFIGALVTSAMIDSTKLMITFGVDTLTVSLEESTPSGERVIMTGPDNLLAVW